MITILLLAVIYIAFISLGLPDAILGVNWTSMRLEFGVPIDQIGYVSVIVTVATILSSLGSGYLIQKLGTAKITIISVFLTASSIIGISYIGSFYYLILLAFPLGFGAGSIDTALNHYVALHFKAHHMNWLHSFWGLGATLGPILLSIQLAKNGWRSGYFLIGMIQFVFFFIVLLSYPLWKKVGHETNTESIEQKKYTTKELIQTNGVVIAILIFVLYCAVEFTVGIWGSSYLYEVKGITVSSAAQIIAIYYGGITVGRMLSGIFSFKYTNRQLILFGIIVTLIGVVLLTKDLEQNFLFVPYLVIGLGLSPIFPAMIHETPTHFGKDKSKYIIGFQMAGAYIGSSIFTPLFGLIARHISITLFASYLLFISLGLLILIITLFVKMDLKKSA